MYILDAANWNMQLMLSLNSRIRYETRAFVLPPKYRTLFKRACPPSARRYRTYRTPLGTHTNAAAGLAALYGLRAELFEFEGASMRLNRRSRQACGYSCQTRRLAALCASGQWSGFAINRVQRVLYPGCSKPSIGLPKRTNVMTAVDVDARYTLCNMPRVKLCLIRRWCSRISINCLELHRFAGMCIFADIQMQQM